MMNRILIVLALFQMVLILADESQAKEWREIVPASSTIDDVRRLMGEPSEKLKNRFTYHLNDYDVDVVFSTPELCGLSKRQSELVLLVRLTLRKRVPLADLGFDQTKFRQFDRSTTDPDFQGYIDDDDGLIIGAHKGLVDRMFYIASAADRSLCPTYYANPERLATVIVDYVPRAFDTYSRLSKGDEEARLDNFALYLLKTAELKGYVVVFNRSKANDCEAIEIGNRIKRYLTEERGLETRRVEVINAGRRERLEVELWALPGDFRPPVERR